MGAVELRNTILDKLNTIEDSSVLVKVLDYVEHIKESSAETSDVTEARLDEIDAMRASYMAGKGKHFTWQEIKQELIDKHGLQTGSIK